jgi:CSLREA domain-containing protein
MVSNFWWKHTRRFGLFGLVICLICSGMASPAAAEPDSLIVVTETRDELNNDGDCSLREAIQAANTNQAVDACPAGSPNAIDEIFLPAGTYGLTLVGIGEDDNLSGDLDIKSDLVLRGSGASQTIVAGRGIDRVFHIVAGTNVTLQGITIQGGMADSDNNGGRGGGLLNKISTLRVTDVVIQNNEAANTGGGIDNFGGTLILQRVTVFNNQAPRGGGIFNGSSLTIANSLFESNTARNFGGGAIYNANSIVIQTSLFLDNTANLNGGGLDNSANAVLQNVTFSGNFAGVDPDTGDGLGGAIFNDGNLETSFLTIVNNTGGGIANGGEARLNSVLLANNTQANCFGNMISEGYNLEKTNTCGFTQVTDQPNTIPLLESLADNGGRTFTVALQVGSPAVDAGDPASCPATDQRGSLRPADGDGDGEARCDVGAFEQGAASGNIFLPYVGRDA